MNAPRKIVLATRNPGKVAEFEALLADLDVDVVPASAWTGAPDVEEDAPTLEGNAQKKAEALFLHTGLPALADDTGLEVEALGGAPGVRSARYAGPESDAEANKKKLLRELDGEINRRARFRTVLAYADETGTRYFEGVCEGTILRHERGTGGFGYDPLFLPDGEALTFAEMDPAEKNLLSHRARALQAFREWMGG